MKNNFDFENLAVFPIFKVKSEQDFIWLTDIAINDFFFQGNGFFISETGHFSSVAHVFKNRQTLGNYYILYKNKLHKIFKLVLINSDCYSDDCVDLALGKINITNCAYYDFDNGADVKRSETLFINGFSKRISSESEYCISSIIGVNFCKIPTKCVSLKYIYILTLKCTFTLKNFFTIEHSKLDEGREGLSGSPVLNKEGRPVGIYKGGGNPDEKGNCKGQVHYFKIIIKNVTKLNFFSLPCQENI